MAEFKATLMHVLEAICQVGLRLHACGPHGGSLATNSGMAEFGRIQGHAHARAGGHLPRWALEASARWVSDRMHPYHVGVKCRARRSEVLGPTCSDPPAKWVWVPAKWVWAQGDSALHAAATAHEGYPQGVEGCIRGVPKGERVQASRECHVAL
eukprot:1143552-Pelagomonas_calceolata.AAC.2